MPTIYRIIRDESERIGEDQGLPKGAAGAVMFGDTSSGEMVSAYLALYKEGSMHVIRHPIEESDLKANGETFSSAQSQGILFNVTPHICKACGATVEVYRLHFGVTGGGCLVPLLIGVVSGLLLTFGLEASVKDGFFGGFLTALVALPAWFALADMRGRLKFREQERKFDNPACSRCGSHEHQSVERIGQKGLTLKTGKRVRVVFAGRS